MQDSFQDIVASFLFTASLVIPKADIRAGKTKLSISTYKKKFKTGRVIIVSRYCGLRVDVLKYTNILQILLNP